MRFWLTATAAGLLLVLRAAHAAAQGLPAGQIDTLAAFIDATVPNLMDQRHIVGTAVVVVHDGKIVFSRGYGQAQLDSGAMVHPQRTLFRVGSVTKLFTAMAAIQLAETGRLDLQRDVREYLGDVPLPYGATSHQLLTHTAGLDERFAGAYTNSAEHLQSLSRHLRRFTPGQLFRPGTASSYSNYNYGYVGLTVERLSGLRFEDYIHERILQPLKMSRTTAHQPPPRHLADHVARGYRWSGTASEPVPFIYTQVAPAGAMTTTAADFARVMLALLGDGAVDDGRVLSAESLHTMLAPQYTPHPRMPASAYGVDHLVAHGQRLLYRGGTLGDQAAMMVLFPADRLGIFVASNALPGLGDFLFEPMMTHLAGPEPPVAPPAPLANAQARASRFAGTYRTYRQLRHEMTRIRGLMPMSQSRVTVESNGAIRWQGRQWLEVEPLLFRRVDSDTYVAFRENERGEITGVGSYERIRWWEQTPFHVGLLAACVLAFVVFPLSKGGRARAGQVTPRPARIARACGVLVALINVTFVVGLSISLRDLGATTPVPLVHVLLLSLPLVSGAVAMSLPVFAALSWKLTWWTLSERVKYSALAVLAVVFVVWLAYWRLLGVRY